MRFHRATSISGNRGEKFQEHDPVFAMDGMKRPLVLIPLFPIQRDLGEFFAQSVGSPG
jgi:hypothetical protein